MTPIQAVAYTIAATATVLLAALGWQTLARWAARHLERFLADALDHDPWTPMDDYLDREHRLLTTHIPAYDQPDTCAHCDTAWPCIPLQALGITRTQEGV